MIRSNVSMSATRTLTSNANYQHPVDNLEDASSSDSASPTPPETASYFLRRMAQGRLHNNRASLPTSLEDAQLGALDDVSLSDDERSGEDSDWDALLAGDSDQEEGEEEEETPGLLPAAVSRARGFLHRLSRSTASPLVFDDVDMVVVEEDEEGDDYRDWSDQPWSFEVPFGPLFHEDYSFQALHPRTAHALSVAQNLPSVQRLAETGRSLSATAHAAGTSVVRTYDDVAGRATHAARRTREMVVVSGQVTGYLAGEAWTAGQDAAARLQESLPGLRVPLPELRVPLPEGMLGTIGEFVREGIQALPPAEAIVRPRGRGFRP
ncbi:hypothetical protein ACJ41O_001109 [Fusarium nematophilum]